MKQFTTIEKLDTGILYPLELASSLSVLLLAFGLIASMANVLTENGPESPVLSKTGMNGRSLSGAGVEAGTSSCSLCC